MRMMKLLFMAAAEASFVVADILFMRSLFCEFHPRMGYWVLHLPLHYLNSLFLYQLYHDQVASYQWHGPGLPVLGLHLKTLVQVSTSFCILLLMAAFNEPLSGDIPDGLDVCLLASTAMLIVYATIVSSSLPDFDLGVSLTASLMGLYVTMLYNISEIGFQLKGAAFVVLVSLMIIKNFVKSSLAGEVETSVV